jgi:CubicO group peptidase (beta-lactamase class C family)
MDRNTRRKEMESHLTLKQALAPVRFAFFLLALSWSCSNRSETTSVQFDQVKTRIQKYVEEAGVPSIAVAVAKDGKIIWEEGFGWANKEKNIKATAQTMYSVDSIAKPMTATGLMVLVERGLIDLNKPANVYLGEVTLRAFEGKGEEATVKRILHHTAGLPMYWHFCRGDSGKRPTPEETIRHFGILVAAPGDRYEYSNLGYAILATIIERESRKAFPEFMRSEVFEPLGLRNTAVLMEPLPADSIAPRYIENRDISPFYDYHLRGASAVYSSAHDLVRFGMFHLKNHLSDQRQILSDNTIEEMQESVDSKLPSSRYKLGWDVGERYGYDVVTHGGGMPGVRTMMLLLPSENIVVAVLCNGGNIELPRIYDPILATLLPKYERGWKAQQSSAVSGGSRTFSPPPLLIGEWIGKITTYNETIPVQLNCDKDGNLGMVFPDDSNSAQTMHKLASPPRFQNGIFVANFQASLPLEEALQSPNTVYLKMKLRDNKLSGTALALCEKEYFGLPSYIELAKKETR